MINSYKTYLCGDSHANYVKKQFDKYSNKIIDVHQTLGGYGFTSFVNEESLNRPPENFIQNFLSFFKKIDKQSIILFSSSDPEIRFGVKDESFKNEFCNKFDLSIKKTINEIKDLCDFRFLIFVDLYPLSPSCTFKNISTELRLEVRDLIGKVFSNIEYDNVSFVTSNRDGVTHSKETGLILEEEMAVRDRTHFNLDYTDNKINIGNYIKETLIKELVKIK